MFKAVLFDLDGTLLDIDMEYFIPQYFRKMVIMARDAGYSIADQLVEKVWQATDVMIANRDARLLNEEVFAEHFYRNWPIPREEFEPFFERFYAEGFPQLQIHSRPFAGIPEMMQQVFDRGLKVVVATNAVFPMIALQQRLDWAGVGHFDYELITSYEVMHFCKPHPEYYQEIAATIGVKPEECMNLYEEEKHWHEIKASQERIENTIYFLQSSSEQGLLASEALDLLLRGQQGQ
jgi:FMN phosphatase YigB (HAD superfamily)